MSFQHTDAEQFRDIPTLRQDKLMDYILSAEIEANNAVTDATHDDRTRVWERWLTWLEAVGVTGDPYLTGLERASKVKMVGGFAVSIR